MMMKVWGAILLLVVIAPTCRAFTSVDELRDWWKEDLDFFGDAISSCDRNVVLVRLLRDSLYFVLLLSFISWNGPRATPVG